MLQTPYKGKLIDLRTEPSEIAELSAYAATLPSVRLSPRELCDLEMLATGAFSPLRTFMGADDHHSVLKTMRLRDGTLFPIPITLTVRELSGINLNGDISLRGPKNDLL